MNSKNIKSTLLFSDSPYQFVSQLGSVTKPSYWASASYASRISKYFSISFFAAIQYAGISYSLKYLMVISLTFLSICSFHISPAQWECLQARANTHLHFSYIYFHHTSAVVIDSNFVKRVPVLRFTHLVLLNFSFISFEIFILHFQISPTKLLYKLTLSFLR